MNERVRRVQELRRSNAAQPRPGKRKGDAIRECEICGTVTDNHTDELCFK